MEYRPGYALHSSDLQLIDNTLQGYGLIVGEGNECVCSVTGVNTVVSYTDGVVKTPKGYYTISAGSIDLSTLQDDTRYKKIWLYIDADDGTVKAGAGTTYGVERLSDGGRKNSTPRPPNLIGEFNCVRGDVVIAEVFLQPIGNNIVSEDVTDRRCFIPNSTKFKTVTMSVDIPIVINDSYGTYGFPWDSWVYRYAPSFYSNYPDYVTDHYLAYKFNSSTSEFTIWDNYMFTPEFRIGDIEYCGFTDKTKFNSFQWDGYNLTFSGDASISLEYYNGEWVPIPLNRPFDLISSNSGFDFIRFISGTMDDWILYSLSGLDEAYWIRFVLVSGTYSSTPNLDRNFCLASNSTLSWRTQNFDNINTMVTTDFVFIDYDDIETSEWLEDNYILLSGTTWDGFSSEETISFSIEDPTSTEGHIYKKLQNDYRRIEQIVLPKGFMPGDYIYLSHQYYDIIDGKEYGSMSTRLTNKCESLDDLIALRSRNFGEIRGNINNNVESSSVSISPDGYHLNIECLGNDNYFPYNDLNIIYTTHVTKSFIITTSE